MSADRSPLLDHPIEAPSVFRPGDLMDAVRREFGSGIEDDFRAGDFSRLKGWLTQHIHRHGQRYRAGELCRRATGMPLSPKPFVSYLTEKFGALYDVC